MGGVWEPQIRSARSILEGLLKTHSHSLNDESLVTLMSEVKSIINSRPLTVETINVTKSDMPLSPSNLLTMKTNFVMPPPGEYSRPDLYSKRRWCRVHHIADEFLNRWRKEFLQILQPRQKWKNKIQNFEIREIVLLKDDCHRNQWLLPRAINVYTDVNKSFCSVLLRDGDRKSGSSKILQQPLTEIVLLFESDFDSPMKRAKQRFQDDLSSWGSQMK